MTITHNNMTYHNIRQSKRSIALDGKWDIVVCNDTFMFLKSVEVTDLFFFSCIKSFSANGNIEVFANNTDTGKSARNELPHMKSALFAFSLSEYFKTVIT